MLSKKLRVALAVAAMVGAGSAIAAPCAVNDVTYSPTFQEDPNSAVNATACANVSPPGPGNPNPEASDINALWNVAPWPYGSGNFLYAAKDDNALTNTPVSLFGGSFTFTLNAIDIGATNGTYLLTATDNNGSTVPNFPLFFDFALTLKGGSSEFAAYLFDNALFDGAGGGAWRVTFTNNGGNEPGLSNLRLFVREGSTGSSSSSSSSSSSGLASSSGNIPEPSSSLLAILGLGLVGGSFLLRRKAGRV